MANEDHYTKTHPRPCPFRYPEHMSDSLPWDQLHSAAALFAHNYGDVDGIGGDRRITDDDLNTLHDLITDARRLVDLAAAAEKLAVWTARDQGMTWQEIGARYGITKQAAQQRFSK